MLCISIPPSVIAEPNIDRGVILQKIAKDINALKSKFPQLKNFVIPKSFNGNYEIIYGFNCHTPQRKGGWSGGTPHPKVDGVWFYISIHSSLSKRQLHTQPKTFRASFGPYRFQLLLKEGKETKPLNKSLWTIFRKHGVVDGLPKQ